MRKMSLPFALLLAGALQGCSAGPTWFGHRDPNSCHEPGSDAWWAEKATLPSGVRQKCKKGKVWPARPRSNQEPQQWSHTYYDQHYWPLPYVCQDRAAVSSFMETQIALGWQEETTLFNHHFESNTQQLTRAGELHLERILHHVPEERRAVYIQSSYDAGLDNLRTEVVNTYMARTSTGGKPVTVAVRECQEFGRPASEVENINSLYNASTPSPRLGSAGGGSGGSSGSSSGAP
ncbi:MAG: hypothetical protein ACK58L_21150 [Planctomycetota bacterium]